MIKMSLVLLGERKEQNPVHRSLNKVGSVLSAEVIVRHAGLFIMQNAGQRNLRLLKGYT
jgi:hypothetical protein